MEILSSYNLIIGASVIVVLSFWFNGISKKTNIPSVLMLIVLGVLINLGLGFFVSDDINFGESLGGSLEILGTVGLIMIVLEAALELELKKEKTIPILKSMAIALIGLVGSAWVAALILYQFIDGMTMQSAWLYATPLSILSSAIIIPSVGGLAESKKEFHIYESTFSDIFGIMMFYFLTGGLNPESDGGVAGFSINLVLTIVIAIVASYIILIFGLIIKNIKLFFPGKTKIFLEEERMHQIYHELHIITLETAFIVF